jgi:hypothetical protein
MRRSCLALLLMALSMACLEVSAWAVVGATQRVTQVSPTNSSATKTTSLFCGASKKVLSAGAFVNAGSASELLLDDVRPSADLSSATVHVVEDETGVAGDWAVIASAICATPPPGLERVAATSALNSSSTKSATATCPAGKRVLGTGADINTLNRQVTLDDLRPNAALTAVTANALEDETGNSANWSVTAYAVCANPIAGLERLSETGPLDVSGFKTLFTSCTGGKVLTGAGADINTFNGQVHLGALDFGGGENIILGATGDETGNPAPWSITSYVICAPGSRREVVTSFADSGPKNVNVTCPVAGQQVTGLGGETIDGAGEVVLDRLRPDPANNALATAFEDDGGFAGDWQLSGNAVCVTPLPGQEIVSNSTPEGPSASRNISVACPTGKRVVGAAAEVVNGLGQVLLDDVRPNAALTTVTANALVDGSGTTRSWGLTARAICAEPPPGLERVAATSDLDSIAPKGAAASCPAGKNVLAGAFDINTFNGQVLLERLTPGFSLTETFVQAIEDVDGNPANWSVTAYAICAFP